ncbi:methyltransferase-like protein 27 [Diadema antillarum]|uniref:methyltransferase-like protein 27 n=1 Tax=Diadema antillarum TaxID=105358 RepID=UPI003A8ADFBC
MEETKPTVTDKDSEVDIESVKWAESTVKHLLGLKQDEAELAYDDIANSYDQILKCLSYKADEETTNVILQTVPDRNGMILEVGCGTGVVGEMMYTKGYRNVYGLDISAECLKLASKKGVYRETIKANFDGTCHLDFTDGYFDALYSVGCFAPGHLKGDSLPEMIRLTKSGGHIIITLRENVFEQEIGGMDLKSALVESENSGVVVRKCHQKVLYIKVENEEVQGLTLVYRVV